MSFPLVNATVIAIEAPGSEEYDGTENITPVWAGSVRGYVREELVEVPGISRVDIFRKTTIVIPADVGKMVQAEHRIIYIYRDATNSRLVKSATWVPQLNRARVVLEDD